MQSTAAETDHVSLAAVPLLGALGLAAIGGSCCSEDDLISEMDDIWQVNESHTGVCLALPHRACPRHATPHRTSPHLTPPHLTPPHPTSPHLTSPMVSGR